MNLRHETRAVRGGTLTLPGARHKPSSLPAPPASFAPSGDSFSHPTKKPARGPRAPRRRGLPRLAALGVNLVDEVQRGFGGRKDVLRQRREVEGSAVALALGDRVVDELFDELALRSVVRTDRVPERRER